MDKRTEIGTTKSPELLKDPHSMAVVTATFYPQWYSGAPKEPLTSDKLRGDLALETLLSAKEQGIQIALVDGGSSEEFHQALKANGIDFQPQRENGSQGEYDQPEFNRKRDIQRRAIITELLHFIRRLEESPKSRISQEKGNESR